MSERAILAGGSGFVGKHLAAHLKRAGWDVVLLSRSPAPETPEGIRTCTWDVSATGPWLAELEGSAFVVNLAGESIAQHWSEEVKKRLLTSRIESTRAVGEAINGCKNPPNVWVNASAIGVYGDRGDELLTEESDPGRKGSVLVDLVVAWEAEAERFRRDGVTLCNIRFGHVLGRSGGLLAPLSLATRLFVGGHFGSGTQMVSWIHIDDLCRAICHIESNRLTGIVNGTAPTPVTNRYLMATMRAVLKRPWAPPIPVFLLKLVEFLGGPPASLLLEGQAVLPTALSDSGFEFEHRDLAGALVDLLKR